MDRVDQAVRADAGGPGATAARQAAARLRAVVDELVALDPAALEAGGAVTLHRELSGAVDRLRALASRLLARVEADGRWSASGSNRTFAEWAARRGRGSVGAARSETALGRALESDLPLTARAVAEGRVTLEHAQVLARLGPTSEARRAALTSGRTGDDEASLLAKAEQLGADAFRREMKRWAARTDAAAHEREYAAAEAKEYLSLGRRPDGVTLQGFLTVEHADVLMTALRGVLGVPAADDARTPEERRAHGLTALARRVLDSGLAGSGGAVRPHLSVHVGWETFCGLADSAGVGDDLRAWAARRGLDGSAAAELDDGEPIPPSVLARIACDSEVTRVVFGPDGRPLDVGRAQRTFTGPQRRAVVARDRHCQYPGCDAPPVLGEVHHVDWWARDRGRTEVPRGVLLCWFHHEHVHRRGFVITWTAAGWRFRRADGTPVEEPRPPGTPGAPPAEPPDDPHPPGTPGAPQGEPPDEPRRPGAPGAPQGEPPDEPRPPGAPGAPQPLLWL